MKIKYKTLFVKKRQVLILVGLISLLIVAGSYFYYSYEENNIHNAAYNRLKAIADLKIFQIANWNKQRLREAKFFSQSPFFVNDLKKWLSSKSNIFIRNEITERIALINSDSTYRNVLITDTKGNLLFSLNPRQKDMDVITKEFVKRAVEKRKIVDTDLYFCQLYNKVHLEYIAPVLDINNVVIATIIFRIEPNDYLYPLINKWPTPSETSETLIIRKEKGGALYLNELAHQKNTALKLRIPLTRKEIPAVQAVLGYKGILEGVNYRGSKVLAYASNIPGTLWVMIAQVDHNEIYADLYFRKKVFISFTILLILVLSVGFIWYYHYRQVNIYRELFIKENELRKYFQEFKTILYSIGDGIITTDANGNVKQMNHASEVLTGWNENEAIGKPIEKIFNIINEETKNKVENPVQKVLKKGIVIGLANHTLLVSKNGEEIPIADSGAPIRDENGEIEGVVLVFRDKTNEYFAEKSIRQSEARLRRAESVSKTGNWELHLDAKTIIGSPGATKLYGVDNKRLDYNVVKNIPLPEYRATLDDALFQTVENGQPYDLDFKIKTVDTGEIKDIHSIAEYDKENRILFGVVQDITERKRSEEALISSEKKFRILVENAPIGIYYVNLRGEFIYGNKTAEEIIGYKKEELIGKNFLTANLLSFKDIAKATKLFALNILGKPTDADQFELIRKNGEHIQTEISTQIITIDERKVVVGMVQDVTERKRAEKTLRESEDRYRDLVENSYDLICTHDLDGNILSANPSASRLLGYDISSLRNMNIQDFIVPEYKKEFKVYLSTIRTKGEATGLLAVKTKSGEKRIWQYNNSLRTKGVDKPIVRGTAQDITERKRSEESLIMSENKYRHLFENNPLPMWVYDLESLAFLEVNGAAVLHYGYSKDEFLSMTLKDIRPSEDVDVLLKDVSNTYKEINQAGTWRHKKKNGEIIFVEITSHLIKYENKSARLVLALDVTKRRLAEEALKESYEFNKSLLQTIPFGMNIVDETGNIIFISDNFKKLFKGDIIGEKCWSLYRDDKTQCNNCPLMTKIKTGETLELESEKFLNGKTFLISHTAMIYEGKRSVLEIFQDITGRREVEKKLRENEERLKQIVDCSGVWVWEVNAEGLYTYVSPMEENILGYKPEELVGKKHFYDFFAEDVKEALTKAAFEVFSKKDVFTDFENHNIHKNGGIVILETSGIPLLDKDGNLLGYRGADKDITVRKNAERTVDLLAQAIRSTDDCISITDTNNNILFVNESFLKTYGYEEEELIGKNIELVRASSDPNPTPEIIKIATLQNGWFGELLNRKKDGTEFPISLSTSSMLNDKGEPYALIGITRDITKIKKTEKELEKYREHLEDLVETRTEELDSLNSDLRAQLQKEKELEMMLKQSLDKEKELNELKTRFISITSHEFRTPLTSVFSSAEMIQRYGKKWSEEKQYEYLDKIKNSVDYLTKLLDDILTISRTESGKILFTPNMIDLYKLCTKVIEETKAGANDRSNFVFNYSIKKVKYNLDPKLMKFILVNLLSNAIKYTPNDGKIELSVMSIKDGIQITVADEGIGIPDADLKHLFEPFHRATNTADIPGTGLGLSIVKHAVDLHQGKISVQSKLREGTRVVVEIPKR